MRSEGVDPKSMEGVLGDRAYHLAADHHIHHIFVTKGLTEGLTNIQTIGLIDVRSHTKACHITTGAQVFRIQLDHLQS